ncbi:hypothetical protein conserved [Leishmania donovani]|uniref:Uncharacterized protein n=3 Tax=Leishmania donovani species complex TaxID=38574 RepID=A4IAD8_LEIIN|nr:conserved hypothetical protein [Leishmania infantum JPCM5]CAC9541040.1 hypothetical_protein_-_conserved [Leishmania infantum]CAJ1992732.1 hypothetical protein conserved [Leishmania donovani]CAM71795.1 conserved hypothetical protein [Leishmania infantum JPCM5]SUZ45750.1 hypothetical_protein_-_conserved [Leishmania infantum]VDZ48564.1 hypothetical_protein_conserved [Leishmania donovani]|eukprot:XP_001468707.1 conserved hypothetical protein [Leishmania infantum JPCM5]
MAHGAEECIMAAPGCVYLTPEQEEQLVDRLYTQSLLHKEATMAELDARYYPVAASQAISQEMLQKSVQRQVDVEMERRQQRRKEMDAMAVAEATGHANGSRVAASKKTMTLEQTDVSVRRLYDDTLARKKARKAESERLYAFHPEDLKSAKLSKAALQESVNRMSKPKKTEFTMAEVNKIYDL